MTQLPNECAPERRWVVRPSDTTRRLFDTADDRDRVGDQLGAEAAVYHLGANPPTTLIELSGELCTSTVRSLRPRVAQMLEHSRGEVLVDLSAVTFIDGRGLSLMVMVRNAAIEHGERCRVTAASPTVRRLFDITDLGSVFFDADDPRTDSVS